MSSQRPDGSLRPSEIRAGMRTNIIAGAFGNVWAAVAVGTPLTMLLEVLGASGFTMGLTQSFRQIALTFQLPGALLAELIGKRRLTWLYTVLFGRSLWLLPPLFIFFGASPATVIAAVMGVAAVTASTDCFVASLWHSWIADLIPEHIRGQFWSTRQAYTTMAMLLATLASGIVLDLGNGLMIFGIVFFVAALFGIADILTHFGVPDLRSAPAQRGESLWARLMTPIRDRNFFRFALLSGIWTFSVTLTVLQVVCIKQAFGASYSEIAVITVASNLSGIIGGFLLGRIIDLVGARSFMFVMILLGPITSLCWFFMMPTTLTIPLPWMGAYTMSQPVAILIVANALAGAFYAAIGMAQYTLLGSIAPKESRTLSMAVYWTIVGAFGAVGPLCAGAIADLFASDITLPLAITREGYSLSFLWKRPADIVMPLGGNLTFGHVIAFLHIITAWCCLPIFRHVKQSSASTSIGDTFSNIVMVNPLRFTLGLVYLRRLNSTQKPHRRRRSIEQLGSGDTRIAVTDLVQKMNDPDFDVREAAVAALGRIGTPSAVHALIGKLHETPTGLAAPILRALRHTRSTLYIPSVLPYLEHPEAEVARQAARALGETRRAECLEPLLDLVRRTADDVILCAASNALSKLGHPEAVYDLFPKVGAVTDAVLQRSIAVDIGNLLGERHDFYQILSDELRDPGVGFETLSRRLLIHLKSATADPRTKRRLAIMRARVRRLDAAIETADYPGIAHRSLRIAQSLAAYAARNMPPQRQESYIEVLVWDKPRFAAGYWLLCAIAETGHAPTALDALLATFVASELSRAIND